MHHNAWTPSFQVIFLPSSYVRPAEKSRTILHVGAPIDDWLKQSRVIARIVFEVRVLYQHDISRCLCKTAPQGRSLALVRRLKEKTQVPQLDLIASILRGREFFAI